MIARPEHQIFFQELCALLKKHNENVDADECLAIAANAVGKIIALQDQRTMTPERAMKIVEINIQIGNQQAIDELKNKTGGSA